MEESERKVVNYYFLSKEKKNILLLKESIVRAFRIYDTRIIYVFLFRILFLIQYNIIVVICTYRRYKKKFSGS